MPKYTCLCTSPGPKADGDEGIRVWANEPEVVQKAVAPHAVPRVPGVLGADLAGAVLEAKHDIGAGCLRCFFEESGVRGSKIAAATLPRGRDTGGVERVETAGGDVYAAVEQVV